MKSHGVTEDRVGSVEMELSVMSSQIKVIGSNGQISLGKESAGKTALVDQPDRWTWVIKIGQFVPDSERWLYANSEELTQLNSALHWAEKHEPVDNFDTLIREFERGENKNRSK